MTRYSCPLRLAAAAAAFLAAACTSGPAASPPAGAPVPAGSERQDALPPQTLSPGECGLFLFELREPNAFVLFENETARQVSLIDDGARVTLGVPPQGGATAPGEAIRRVYLDQARNITYTLTGRVGEETGSGQRLESVILRARTLDGVETVTPLGGVRRCMARRAIGGAAAG